MPHPARGTCMPEFPALCQPAIARDGVGAGLPGTVPGNVVPGERGRCSYLARRHRSAGQTARSAGTAVHAQPAPPFRPRRPPLASRTVTGSYLPGATAWLPCRSCGRSASICASTSSATPAAMTMKRTPPTSSIARLRPAPPRCARCMASWESSICRSCSGVVRAVSVSFMVRKKVDAKCLALHSTKKLMSGRLSDFLPSCCPASSSAGSSPAMPSGWTACPSPGPSTLRLSRRSG